MRGRPATTLHPLLIRSVGGYSCGGRSGGTGQDGLRLVSMRCLDPSPKPLPWTLDGGVATHWRFQDGP
eukprot:4188739-Pyramimonas_sp.AAC.1